MEDKRTEVDTLMWAALDRLMPAVAQLKADTARLDKPADTPATK
jgi:hypothetical protein